MSAVTGTIPNLLNGVSSQAAVLRLPTQGEEQINGYSALTRGLIKRPPTKLVKNIGALSGASAYIHTINRDSAEKYIVVIMNGDLKVFDLDGNEKTVTFPDGVSYLHIGSSDAAAAFTAVSVNDYTFITNRNRVVEMDESRKTNYRIPEALITVRQGNYARKYKIIVDGTTAAYVQTPDGSNRSHYNAIDTTIISSHLWRALLYSGSWGMRDYYMGVSGDYGSQWDYSGVTGSGLAPYTGTGKFHASHYNSSIHLYNDTDDFTVTTQDGQSGNGLKVVKGKVQKFTDLPNDAPDGIVFEVEGDVDTGSDNYWVQFDAATASWTESMAPGTVKGFSDWSMPHILVRNSNGTFTFKQAPWSDRIVGSNDSPSVPSFVGSTINSVFFHRNRLGFLSDDNIILSEAGEYFNFWPRTLTTVLDTDPIDIGSSFTEVTIFRSAVPYAGDLAVFSDQGVFRLTGGDILTPKSAALKAYGAFNIYRYCKPEVIGTVLLWPSNDGTRTVIREMWTDDTGIAQAPLEANSHCPQYIPANVRTITGSADLNIAMCLSKNDPTSLYVYKYYWSGAEKPQSSWSKWTFPFTILNVKFIDTTLYMVVNDGSSNMLLSMACQVDATETGQKFAIHLDKRVTVAGTYTSGTNTTSYTLPYSVPSDIQAWTVDGHRLIVASYSGSVVKLQGDTTAETVILGVPYTFQYKFSKLIMKQNSQNGGTVAIMDGRLQIIRMAVQYSNAAEFSVRVTSTNGNIRTSTMNASGFTLDDPLFLTEDVVLSQGQFSFPVKHENWSCDIELLNDSALPTDFTAVDWTALFTPKTRRI